MHFFEEIGFKFSASRFHNQSEDRKKSGEVRRKVSKTTPANRGNSGASLAQVLGLRGKSPKRPVGLNGKRRQRVAPDCTRLSHQR